jgi:hypothetical protein
MFLLFLAALAGLYSVRSYLGERFRWRWELALGLVLAAAVTLVCFREVPPKMRVQWDETHLVSTAQTMRSLGTAETAIEAVWQGDKLLPIQLALDKRPPLFSFLVSGLLALGIPAPEAAFVLNAGIFFVFLFLAYAETLEITGTSGAITSIFLIASVPLVVLCATSAGFDLFSALLFFCCWRSLLFHLADRRWESFLIFMTAGLFFSYTRYESVFVFLFLLAFSQWETKSFRNALICILLVSLPLLLTPLLMLEIHAFEAYLPMDMANAKSVFGFWQGFLHFSILFREFFNPLPWHPFYGPGNLFGCVGIILYLRRLEWRREWFISILAPALVTAIPLLWYYGDASEPAAFRFFIPIGTLGALSAIVWLRLVNKRAIRIFFASIACLAFLFQVHSLHEGTPGHEMWVSEATKEIDDLLLAPELKKEVFVSDVSEYFVLRGYAAIDPDTFREKRRLIAAQLRDGRMKGVIFVDLRGGVRAAKVKALLSEVKCEPLLQKRILSALRWRPSSQL